VTTVQLDSIAHRARQTPAKAAIIMGGTGEVLTYGELDARANQGARLLHGLGATKGDALGLCIDNSPAFFQVACAAQRAGLTLIPVSTKLTAREIAHIVADSGAKVLVMGASVGHAVAQLLPMNGVLLFATGAVPSGFRSWDAEAGTLSTAEVEEAGTNGEMLYSSGTTGRPKGIRYVGLPDTPGGLVTSVLATLRRLGLNTESVYLCPAPLYHAAPFSWSIGTLRLGGTVVVMEVFDPEQALALIERYRVDISQWVPTHFVRMLKLPEGQRLKYDISSLRLAIHAAAPCPVPVKREMITWWGPILLEYFGCSEQSLLTIITSEEWLSHPGSVGRCVFGELHICDDQGEPVPPKTIGQVHSQDGMNFIYHNDPEKTKQSRNRLGWTTVGDMGFLDEDGYLFLTDRKNFMIISGGVNVYPQEVENLLVTHPRVADAAVFGVPDHDLGEKVVALVQPLDMEDATPAFADELKNWMRESLSGVKVPKLVVFRDQLPRLPTGKMAKHLLREEFSHATAE
jgi:long-chain acyl-CoA synthetase